MTMNPNIERTVRQALAALGARQSPTTIRAVVDRARRDARGSLTVGDVWAAARAVADPLNPGPLPPAKPRPVAPVSPLSRREPTRADALAWARRTLARRAAKREKAALLAWGESVLAERRAVRELPSLDPAFAARQADRERLVPRLVGTHVAPAIAAVTRAADGTIEVREVSSVYVPISAPPSHVAPRKLSPEANARVQGARDLAERLVHGTRVVPQVERDARTGRVVSTSPEALVSAKAGAR